MFACAFVAGVINSIAGGGTLITFPVLIWLGLDPKICQCDQHRGPLARVLAGCSVTERTGEQLTFSCDWDTDVSAGRSAWLLIWTPSRRSLCSCLF